ncbi:putative Acid phosphatase [Helianthus annuus]|nr:putative Acid phosphatase [Helianthus annuus]
MKNQRETLMCSLLFVVLMMVMNTKVYAHSQYGGRLVELSLSYCLSWRLAEETGNIQGGALSQFNVFLMLSYVDEIIMSDDGLDAWILDVDDTCLSNIFYYKGKRFGGDPYDPQAFKEWASRGICRAIPPILRLFQKLIDRGFKVFLISGRDETTFEQPTLHNLHFQGFFGFERLILRSEAYKGQSGMVYKSEMRRKLVEEGYRIWGNVGDQWSDLRGQFVGNRTFKLPNPMYFVP